MRLNKALPWFPALLVLGGCPGGNTKEPAHLNEITVTCDPNPVVAGQTTKCTAEARDQYGEKFTSVSGYDWKSSNESVAKVVDKAGNATTSAAGTVTISASATSGNETRQGEVTLTVNQRPPTLHTTNITTSETWRAAENPHVVRGQLVVNGTGGAPTLTLEQGVEVRFDQDAELRISNGAFRALGSQGAPIRMVANQSAPPKGYWRGVVFSTEGSGSELSFVTLSDCGNAAGAGACLAVENKAAPVLRDVTVQNSGTVGVKVADDGSAFGTGSTRLHVSGSTGYAVHMAANQAGTLPTGGSFTGNAPNAVELSGNVSLSQTWPNPGIPYVINSLVLIENPPDDSTPENAPGPTLTLSAGTVFRFGATGEMVAGYHLTGDLIVNGTESSPILFTADSDNPKPGQWRGVHLADHATAASRISYTTIEYAGAASSLLGTTGNLNVHGSLRPCEVDGPCPIIQNVVVQKGSGYGVYMSNGAKFGPGSTALSLRDNGNYPLSLPAHVVGTIPTGITFSGNTPNAVEISGSGVDTTQTWRNLGIPYVIQGNVNVGYTTNPTLTVEAGTQLRFAQNTELTIGSYASHPGALIAVGTAEAPIHFIPNTSTPTKGYWRGLHFFQGEGSRLDHVLISHSGAAGRFFGGNLNVYKELGAFVTNSTFSSSASCGVTVSDGSYPGTTAVTTDFSLATYNNTFVNNGVNKQCADAWIP
ncbi:MAG TPA: Ig-like domain-containing protein [Archangium sp.]|uniref:Ig-like domain-containing protein n=1 Tax=Archangium sp. TaxID=1872627 RepID=UPI002E322E35|nr:Ig-like domain-containing protein [Archangium sp.]HEX5745427.1 Ig-like domain-containing protein [Archangium sp.]